LHSGTVAEAISAGADVLVVGGAVVKAENPRLAVAGIREAMDGAEGVRGDGKEERDSAAGDAEDIQAAARRLLSRINSSLKALEWNDLLNLAQLVRRSPRIYVTGAGRTGLVARSFGMRLMQLGLPAYIPGETVTPGAREGDLVLALSYTGRTGGTSYLVRRAREIGATVVLVTGAPESPMAERADRVLLVRSFGETPFERAVAFEHAVKIALDALFDVLSCEDELDPETFRRRHANLE
jgi:6-phospho 3-hexuloisomerase